MKPWYDVNKAGGSKFCSRKCIDTFKRKIRKREEQEMFTGWQKREWKDSSCKKCGTTDKLELDHIMPRFAGGKASRENAQTLCRTCNRKKFWTEDYELYQNMLKLRTITD
jgi:5-methylcytosine-specific restriction endonuclease McrA